MKNGLSAEDFVRANCTNTSCRICSNDCLLKAWDELHAASAKLKVHVGKRRVAEFLTLKTGMEVSATTVRKHQVVCPTRKAAK